MTDAIHFEHAPLDEVVCGVQFGGVKWSDIHFGLFYAEVSKRYPQTQRRPPIHPSVFGQGIPVVPQIELVTEPDLPLLWYESEDSPFLLQVQRDAFLVNWRRQSGRFRYPHFRTRQGGPQGVWDCFVFEWQEFCRFCERYKIGTPEVLACHLACIDHMVQGETWNDPIDLSRWFRFLAGLKDFESTSFFTMAVMYQVQSLPIHINIHHAVRKSDQKKIFIINSIITGKLSPESTLEAWFDKAHELIVQQFVAQTTEEAHMKWGLSHG
jgi:uncharacterized protein (TIGR04255 family)